MLTIRRRLHLLLVNLLLTTSAPPPPRKNHGSPLSPCSLWLLSPHPTLPPLCLTSLSNNNLALSLTQILCSTSAEPHVTRRHRPTSRGTTSCGASLFTTPHCVHWPRTATETDTQNCRTIPNILCANTATLSLRGGREGGRRGRNHGCYFRRA